MARSVQPLHPVPRSSARIVLSDGITSIACLLRSVSESGAVVQLHVRAAIPNAFRLSIGQEPARPCWVVRRDGRELTVAFTDWSPAAAAS